MKGRPLLVLLLFAASAVILTGMYYAATREGTTTRQDKWAGVLSDLDACSRRKHVKSAQYDHFAGIARQEREHDAERLFRAMAHAERLQEYNCANAIVRLGGRYAPPEHVTVFRGTTDDNLRRSIDFARRPPEGLHADDIERALQSGNRYAARVLIWARSGDMRHLALMETCRRRLAANGPADARNEIAGRRANNGTAGVPADGTRFRTRNSRRFGKQSAGRYGRQHPERLSGLSDLRQHLSGGVQRFLLPLLPDRRAEVRRVRRVTHRRIRIFTRLSRAARPNRQERIPSARRIRTARHGSGAWFCRGNRCRRSSRPHGAGPAARNRRSADHRGNY